MSAKKFIPHISVLGLVKESNVGMGRQLLASCVTGETDERIRKLRLNRLVHFSSLPLYDKKDIFELIDLLLQRGYLEYKALNSNKFLKVISLTKKGEDELRNPSDKLDLKRDFEGHYARIDKVTDEDRALFGKLGSLLDGLSDEQRKGVTCPKEKILCIAGAGSGKTRVLTKRVWYLATLRSVDHSRILAVTFTRKARKEMMNRLDSLIPGNQIQVETFNSFCEKILSRHANEVYGREFHVMDYKAKVKLVMQVIKDLQLDVDSVLDTYYSEKKVESEDRKLLFLGFINDMFAVLDYQRNNDIEHEELLRLISGHYDYTMTRVIKDILSKIVMYKKEMGLRDYTDQITHVNGFFRKDPSMVPRFDHVLIDEYQDINSLQHELISLLNPPNIFAVGDPRQSIYGWRGSKIEYILDFEKLYPGAAVLQLDRNYRSARQIVDVCNKVISSMKLPDLVADDEGDEKCVNVIKHEDEDAEALFVAQSILSLDCKRSEIFVLARTNSQLDRIASSLDSSGIRYLKRTIEEQKANLNPEEDQVTISTVHAIKGLEADVVYVIGANAKNHPCKASEHPVLEAVKINDTYDKYSEELRLFYVALSRAKRRLIISYSGSITKYMGDDVLSMLKAQVPKPGKESEPVYKINRAGASRLYDELKSWRREEAMRLNIPPYQIFSDKTLDELCQAMPSNFEELQEITGFGPFKVRKFGRDIIMIITNNS